MLQALSGLAGTIFTTRVTTIFRRFGSFERNCNFSSQYSRYAWLLPNCQLDMPALNRVRAQFVHQCTANVSQIRCFLLEYDIAFHTDIGMVRTAEILPACEWVSFQPNRL